MKAIWHALRSPVRQFFGTGICIRSIGAVFILGSNTQSAGRERQGRRRGKGSAVIVRLCLLRL